MQDSIQALYDQLAKTLGAESVPADANGIVQLDVGEASRVMMIPEDADILMLMSPVCEMPAQLDRGRAQWLLQRNFHNSPLMPFRVACDSVGTVTIWGRVPVAGLTGEALAALIDGVAGQADLIREELEVDETPDDDAEEA